MKFVLAPDSFKESMTAKVAAEAMEKGIKEVFPEAECIIVPMADGGEGTVESLVDGSNGVIVQKEVTGPLGNKVIAEYGLLGDGKTAVIEMASASGLHLVLPEQRNPLITTTYGTGELIRDALEHGITRILIGIGGSATNDGGVGMLQALGASFRDKNGKELPFGGGALHNLESIDLKRMDSRLSSINIEVACDVTNPLIGKNGASFIFGPQKGATEKMVKLLDENLSHYAKKIKDFTGMDIAEKEGAGAAGGLGAGLLVFLNAEIKRGIDLVIEYTDLENKLDGTNFVFTGEGSIDGQTLFGKTPFGVAKLAKKHHIPVIAFAGRVGSGVEELYHHGFTAVIGILKEVTSIEAALMSGRENLQFATENVCRIIKNKII